MLQTRCMMGTMSVEDEDEEDYGNEEEFDSVSEPLTSKQINLSISMTDRWL